MTTLARHRDLVIKTFNAAEIDPYFAVMPAGAEAVLRYVRILREVGVSLPGDLSVASGLSGAEVRYDWIPRPTLQELPEERSADLTAAVTSVAGWVQALEHSDARLDANLANFVISDDGGVTCIDVLPPLLAGQRPPEPGPWEQVIGGLCFDTNITLCALAGYAAQRLLRVPGHMGSDAVAGALQICPGHQRPSSLAARWFHSRLQAAELAVTGQISAAEAQRLIAATSVRGLQAASPTLRQQHADAALAVMAGMHSRRTS